jgi:hypothetical protein
VSFRRLGQLSASELDALCDRARTTPVLVCPGGAEAEDLDVRTQEAIMRVAGGKLTFSAPAPVSAFTFARSDELWPFSGLTLREAVERTLPACHAQSNGIEPLVTTERGAVFLRGRSRQVYITLVPLGEESDHSPLKHQLEPERFMSLIPLLIFLRSGLGESGWLQQSVRATFMVDDPNLRLARYGFLHLVGLVDAARENGFHTSIGMIPLDFRKTRPSVAELVARHPESISLVPHGVDHLWGEFSSDVPLAFAESMLFQGLLRMDVHRSATGISHPRAVTFPHGLGNATWLQAMRNVGLDAAINKRSYPFRLESEIDHPLFELLPAEATLFGFPVVNRFQAEKAKERLLFAAFLGKPLIVYTHHDFFRRGLEPLLHIAEFLNRHVSPEWASTEAILRRNYQTKRSDGRVAIRAFSNRIVLTAEEHSSVRVIFKPGADFPPDEECRVDSNKIRLHHVPDGVGALIPDEGSGREISFGPPRRALDPAALRRPRLKSRLRRWATEFRDQVVLPASARLPGR